MDDPVGGVYPVLFYDDFTGPGLCGDNGPFMWAGFVHETEPDTFEGRFGTYWCPDNGDGVQEDLLGIGISLSSFTIDYDSGTDTISGGVGECVGTRQLNLDSPNEAAEEISEGEYPPPDPGAGSC